MSDLAEMIRLRMIVKQALATYKGGPGSGNFGHAGRPGEVGGSSNSINSQDQYHRVSSIAKSLNIKRKVAIADNQEITLHGDLSHGYYDKETDTIVVSNDKGLSDKQITGIIAHENNHGDFENISRDKWERELINQNKEFMEMFGDDYDFDERQERENNYRIMVKEIGGVSNYSNSYWTNDVISSRPYFDRAMSETFAEIARLKTEGDIVPGFWNDLYGKVFTQ